MGKLFQSYGFHLLASKRDDIQIGDVYEGTENGIEIRSVDRLEEFIKPKNIVPTPQFKYPNITRNSDFQDYKGVDAHLSDTKLALEFFRGLFNKIKKGFGASLSTKFTSEKILNAAYVFKDNTVDSVRINSLSRSLENFMFGRYYSKDKRYYVVTQVYRSKEVGLLFVAGNTKDLNISLDVADLAKLTVGRDERENNVEVTFWENKEKAIPFAVELGELTYTSQNIDVKHVTGSYVPKSDESPKRVSKKPTVLRVTRTKSGSQKHPVLREVRKKHQK